MTLFSGLLHLNKSSYNDEVNIILYGERWSIMDNLKQQIKELIISSLELEDIKPENIQDSAPIFGEGLGLDSIDALELGVVLKKKFGIKFSAESTENRKHFASVDSLAEYITAETAGNRA